VEIGWVAPRDVVVDCYYLRRKKLMDDLTTNIGTNRCISHTKRTHSAKRTHTDKYDER